MTPAACGYLWAIARADTSANGRARQLTGQRARNCRRRRPLKRWAAWLRLWRAHGRAGGPGRLRGSCWGPQRAPACRRAAQQTPQFSALSPCLSRPPRCSSDHRLLTPHQALQQAPSAGRWTAAARNFSRWQPCRAPWGSRPGQHPLPARDRRAPSIAAPCGPAGCAAVQAGCLQLTLAGPLSQEAETRRQSARQVSARQSAGIGCQSRPTPWHLHPP